MSQYIQHRIANLAFLKPDFEILDFLTPLVFFGNQKSQTKSGFFQSERLGCGCGKTSCLFITSLF